MNNRINYQLMGVVIAALAIGSLGNAKASEHGSKACQLGKYLQSRADNDGDDCGGADDNDGPEAIPKKLNLGL